MASISKRPGKSGMTYRIQVKIKDKGSGEIKVHSTTWKPPVGLTPKQMEREVVLFAAEYETAVKAAETASGEPTQSPRNHFLGLRALVAKKAKRRSGCELLRKLRERHRIDE